MKHMLITRKYKVVGTLVYNTYIQKMVYMVYITCISTIALNTWIIRDTNKL